MRIKEGDSWRNQFLPGKFTCAEEGKHRCLALAPLPRCSRSLLYWSSQCLVLDGPICAPEVAKPGRLGSSWYEFEFDGLGSLHVNNRTNIGTLSGMPAASA
jgi:hypothetical protein